MRHAYAYADVNTDCNAHAYVYTYIDADAYTNAYADCCGNKPDSHGFDRDLRRLVNSFHRNSQENLRQQPGCRQDHHLHSKRESCRKRGH
jgi:hypothetical protein